MPATTIDSTGVEHFTIPSFKFVSGHVQDDPVTLAYRSYNPSSPKTVLIPTCYGGRINSTLTFPGALSSHHTIVVAMLSNGESTSPSNSSSFPRGEVRHPDQISAQYALLQHLQISSLHAVIGFSMGAQQAYHWAVIHGSSPDPYLRNAVVVCGSAKTSGHNYAFLEGPISALSASADYEGGAYRAKKVHPAEGLRAFGRAYAAWLTSPEWFRRELWRGLGFDTLRDFLYPPPGQAGFESWDADDLLSLARCWQEGDVGTVAGGGDWRKALEGIQARVLVMPSKSDQYFDWRDGEEEMKFLKRGVWAPIETIWGHIAGGGANKADVEWMEGEISEFLGSE